MATEQTLCEPCEKRSASNLAVKFCTDCDVPLCSFCIGLHTSLKVLSTHHLVSIDISQNSGFNLNKYCEYHADLPYDTFCISHDRLCCRKCIVEEHRSCPKILPLLDAATGIRESVLFEEFSSDLQSVEDTCMSFLNRRRENRSNLTEQKDAMMKDIDNYYAVLVQHLDEIKEAMKSKVDSVFELAIENEDKVIERFRQENTAIKDMKNQLTFLVKQGSESQLFTLMNNLKVTMAEKITFFEKFLSSYESIIVKFERNSSLLSNMSCIGQVSVNTSPQTIEDLQLRFKSAQQNITKRTHAPDFVFDRNIQIEKPRPLWISSIGVRSNGELVSCNFSATSVIILTENGEHVDFIEVGSNPWGLFINIRTDQAFVTLPNEGRVQIINLTTRKPIKSFKCQPEPHGISLVDDVIVIGGRGEYCTYNESGTFMRTIKMGRSLLYSISKFPSGNIICCESNASSVHIVTLSGTVLFSGGVANIKNPLDVTEEDNGRVYIVDWNQNKLVCIDEKGSGKEVRLPNETLNEPWSVTFNLYHSKMYIYEHKTKQIAVFTLK